MPKGDPYTRQTANDQLVIGFEGEDTLFANFRRFHADNPQVFDALKRLAREWVKRRPGQRCGIGMLFERARWDLAFETVGEPLKLNNNYRSFYARKLMADCPDLANLFETRKLRY